MRRPGSSTRRAVQHPRFVCPDCGKKGVTQRLRRNGEDHWGCRYCPWYAYSSGFDVSDVEGRARLFEVNKDHPEFRTWSPVLDENGGLVPVAHPFQGGDGRRRNVGGSEVYSDVCVICGRHQSEH